MTSPATAAIAGNRSRGPRFIPWIGCGLLLLSVLTAGCSFTPTNYRNIQEVDRLCVKDGGIRVYEQVKLPATLFAPDGLPNSRKLESDFILTFQGWCFRQGKASTLNASVRVLAEKQMGRR